MLAYLLRVNQQLSRTPEDVRRLAGPRWTPDLLQKTYERLRQHPIDYTHNLPPRLDRRYIVTGGSGEFSSYHRLRRASQVDKARCVRCDPNIRARLQSCSCMMADESHLVIVALLLIEVLFALHATPYNDPMADQGSRCLRPRWWLYRVAAPGTGHTTNAHPHLRHPADRA